MAMECSEVRDRVAGWLDDELSPGELELMGQHLERCEACAQLVAALSEQDLAPPPVPELDGEAFWAPMDAALARELDAAQAAREVAPAAPAAAPWRRPVLLHPAVVALYAALLLLSLGFAGVQSWRAGATAQQVEALQGELDRYQRLSARPEGALPVETWSVAVHTPHRGSL